MSEAELREQVIEKIADWLEAFSPKYNTTDSGWVIIPEVAKERYRNAARNLLLITEQARQVPELKVLDDKEKLCCSLIGTYCYDSVKDVIHETCLHQRDYDLQQIGEANK